MRAKTNMPNWLLAGATVIAVMAGYYFWTARENATVVESVTVEPGMVSGIMYAEENPSAVIGYGIVHEGDTIDDVKVVKIHKDKVEFEKNGRRWTQRVWQMPNGAWQKVEQHLRK